MRASPTLALALVICGVVVGSIACRPLVNGRSSPTPSVTAQPTSSIALRPVVAPNPSLAAPHSLGSTPSPDSCGQWSADAAIANQYGEIRDCARFGTVWAIFTLGKIEPDGERDNGVIGLYPCDAADAGCLSNQTDHPLAGWHFYELLYPGGATMLFSGDVVDQGEVRIDDGGHQICFSLLQHAFLGPC